jgi:GDP-L-fucose synthase
MEADASPEPLNIGTGTDLTIAELAALVTDVVGFRGKVSYDSSKPDGTPQKLLDVGRLRALGTWPTTPLRDGIAKAYAAAPFNPASID